MSVTDLLNSAAGKSFKFDQIGATVTGTITSATTVQKRDFDSGEPEVWADGQPVQQVKIALQTTLRDPGDTDDDGIRNVYVKGWGDQLRELRRAVKAAGDTDLQVGGTFTATYTGDGELPQGKRGFPPKMYAFHYRKPSGVAGVLAGQQQPTAHHAPTAAQQNPQPPRPAADTQPAGAPTAEQLAAFQAYLATQGQSAHAG